MDLDFKKVLCAVGVNYGSFASVPMWMPDLDASSKVLLTFAQVGVAAVTIVYVLYKIRNEKRK